VVRRTARTPAVCYNCHVKILNGKELAGYIKERQLREVRALKQAHHVEPRLAIVLTIDHPTINVYMRMKKKYGADLDIEVDVHQVSQDDAPALIKKLNEDNSVQAIIVQLPLERPEETETLVNLVAPEKDVDALGAKAAFDPATPMAILWLLAGYNVDLMMGKQVLLVGRGKLVGAPLERMLVASGINVTVADSKTTDLKAETLKADVIITATGKAGLIHADMIKQGAVVVDAGVAGEGGKTVGDLAPDVYERDDLTLTPTKGGVGPLTVSALFENVIRACRRLAEKQSARRLV
jgi:methylenetetrahydrofolate dehydrogenase (NADP+) / methenyltetrahydrofolate cyclohydrolase